MVNARRDQRTLAIADREERQAWWTAVMRGEPDGTAPTLSERLRASELLGRAQGDFVERREVTGRDGGPIEGQGLSALLASVERE